MSEKTLRVLCIDGGGMRGIYTSAYLSRLAKSFATRRGAIGLDIGKAFDLIVGTSTGGIIACGLALGIPQSNLCELYRQHGRAIFPKKLPKGLNGELAWQLWGRPKALELGDKALKKALLEQFGSTTMESVYKTRHVALAIPAVEMTRHQAWVFKTPHLSDSFGRDNGYSLVDVCMATSAAPIYRSLGHIPNPDGTGYKIFADGGLWASSPILVGLVDALRMTTSGDKIELYSLGNCPRPAGEQISPTGIHRGLSEWKFGAEAVSLSLDAQESAFHFMTGMIAPHLDRQCEIIRFPSDPVPADMMHYLDLDETSEKGLDALVSLANRDVDITLSRCTSPKNKGDELLCSLFNDMPVVGMPVNC